MVGSPIGNPHHLVQYNSEKPNHEDRRKKKALKQVTMRRLRCKMGCKFVYQHKRDKSLSEWCMTFLIIASYFPANKDQTAAETRSQNKTNQTRPIKHPPPRRMNPPSKLEEKAETRLDQNRWRKARRGGDRCVAAGEMRLGSAAK